MLVGQFFTPRKDVILLFSKLNALLKSQKIERALVVLHRISRQITTTNGQRYLLLR